MRAGRLAAPWFVLVAGIALATETAPNRDWLPLQQGNRWSYRSSKETHVQGPQSSPQVIRASAREVDEITRRLGKDAFEIVMRSGAESDASAAGQQVVQTTAVARTDAGLVMTAGDLNGMPIQIVRTPVMFPAAAQPGLRFDAGALLVQGLRFDLRGEVLAHEDVRTPAGNFPRCLGVRFTGQLSGELEVAQGISVRIEQGSFEHVEWYAAGVGAVKARASSQMRLRMPDGGRVESVETTERILDAYQVGGLPASPAR